MKRKTFLFFMVSVLSCAFGWSQETTKSDLQQKAEAAEGVATKRYLYIRSYEDYVNKGKIKQGVECGVKATALYYKENYYQEAFDLLKRIDQSIASKAKGSQLSSLKYLTTKERMQMYVKMKRSASALEQIDNMENHANASNDEALKNDLLYNKAICYYTFGQVSKGDAVFKEMAAKLTTSKEYDKVDEAYQTLINNGLKNGSVNLVSQSYRGYIAWKDSVSALKSADEIGGLKKQISDHEATIEEKDSSITSRNVAITGLSVLSAVLAAALVLVAFVLLRFIVLSRKQKKTIKETNENNALLSKFISNISAQLTPTLQKLDSNKPEVKALQDFAKHVETLSDLESTPDNSFETKDTQLTTFCEEVMNSVRGREKSDVKLIIDVPKMSAKINREHVAHILKHLLCNAATYTPSGGQIELSYKKRSAHKNQFIVTNSGSTIPKEKHEDVFKPFLEIRDLTDGDGLGLPICKKMAQKMNGDLVIDEAFTRGTRFILSLEN